MKSRFWKSHRKQRCDGATLEVSKQSWSAFFLMGLWGACALTVCPLTAGCSGSSDSPKTTTQIKATATVGMVADIVRNVGGDDVEVLQIMGSGVDPHLYKATRDDVRLIMQSDIVFYSGLMLEGKMIDTLQKLGAQHPVIAATQALDADDLLQPDDVQGHYDPHVWMDASAWRKCINVVADGLSKLRPELEPAFRSRAAAYEQQLIALDAYAKRLIASIPQENRVLITSHDAFNYFGRAYGIEVLGVQGLSTESEAGLQQINALVDLLVDRGIAAVFVESSVPRKNIQALIDGAAARNHKVIIGGELYSDAMGQFGTYTGTYIGMFEHNVNTITAALQGNVPEGGFSGEQLNQQSESSNESSSTPQIADSNDDPTQENPE